MPALIIWDGVPAEGEIGHGSLPARLLEALRTGRIHVLHGVDLDGVPVGDRSGGLLSKALRGNSYQRGSREGQTLFVLSPNVIA